jgi:hypothetical protein
MGKAITRHKRPRVCMYSYIYTDTYIYQEFLVKAQMTSEVYDIFHPMVGKYESMQITFQADYPKQ